jgi:hypothetical protein
MIAMYRVFVDQQARDEIAAAGAAHRELGPGYADAVAEGLVERIGIEIDKRVDARLAQYGGQPAPHVPPTPHVQPAQHSAPPAQRSPGGQVSPAARPPWSVVVLALGSMLMGVFASAAVLNSHGSGSVVALVWIVIGIINIAYARRH